MKVLLSFTVAVASAFLLSACLTTPTADSGGLGSITVPNSNPTAIIAAAQNVFAQSGYSTGVVNFPTSVSFEKPASAFGNAMWGSYGAKATIRVKLAINPVGASSSYALSTRVYSVTDAGDIGMEDKTKRSGLFAAEFKPLLRQVQSQAAGAGPAM